MCICVCSNSSWEPCFVSRCQGLRRSQRTVSMLRGQTEPKAPAFILSLSAVSVPVPMSSGCQKEGSQHKISGPELAVVSSGLYLCHCLLKSETPHCSPAHLALEVSTELPTYLWLSPNTIYWKGILADPRSKGKKKSLCPRAPKGTVDRTICLGLFYFITQGGDICITFGGEMD